MSTNTPEPVLNIQLPNRKLPVAMKNFKLGMLTFRAVVYSNDTCPQAFLFQCDCGRFVRVWLHADTPTMVVPTSPDGRYEKLPYCCEKCDFDPLHAVKYLPWSDTWENKRSVQPVLSRHADRDNAKMLKDDFSVYALSTGRRRNPKEYMAWRRVVDFDDTYEPWKKSFNAFLNDVGKAPYPNSRIDTKNKRKPYTPANTYWARPTKVVYNGKERPDNYVAKYLDIPVAYIKACRFADYTDADLILKRYRKGLPPPLKGESTEGDLDDYPQFYLD